MVSYKKASKTHKKRRSKKGGDGEKDKPWDIEMGPRSESPEQLAVNEDANWMETGMTKFSPEPGPGDEQAGGKRRRGNKSKKHHKKGSMSKTRKGHKDFITHKGDKDFHRRGHRQSKRQGKKSKSLLARIFGM